MSPPRGRPRARGPGFFSTSPQRCRSSEAQVHVFTTSVIGAAVSRMPGRDSFIDRHSGTLHRFWLTLLQGRCGRRGWSWSWFVQEQRTSRTVLAWPYTVGAGAMYRTASAAAVELAGVGAVCSTTCAGAAQGTINALDTYSITGAGADAGEIQSTMGAGVA